MKKIVVILLALAMTSVSFGQFAESFDSSGADVTVNLSTDAAASYLDYSSLESPKRLAAPREALQPADLSSKPTWLVPPVASTY